MRTWLTRTPSPERSSIPRSLPGPGGPRIPLLLPHPWPDRPPMWRAWPTRRRICPNSTPGSRCAVPATGSWPGVRRWPGPAVAPPSPMSRTGGDRWRVSGRRMPASTSSGWHPRPMGRTAPAACSPGTAPGTGCGRPSTGRGWRHPPPRRRPATGSSSPGRAWAPLCVAPRRPTSRRPSSAPPAPRGSPARSPSCLRSRCCWRWAGSDGARCCESPGRPDGPSPAPSRASATGRRRS